MRNNFSVLNVYKKKTKKSKVVTQLLYGESFQKIKKFGPWISIKNDTDNYKGFIANNNFPPGCKNTHKITNLSANIYSKPNFRFKLHKMLSFGSKIKVLKTKGIFCKFDGVWIKRKDLQKISVTHKEPFYKINKFLNVQYKWGGKHFNGVDCSGLVQIFLNYNNRFCPRDTNDQLKYFKKKIKLTNIQKNDLIFWKGHVAIAISKKMLIHAYGPKKKVVAMPINKTIKLIEKTAKLKVKDIRRI